MLHHFARHYRWDGPKSEGKAEYGSRQKSDMAESHGTCDFCNRLSIFRLPTFSTPRPIHHTVPLTQLSPTHGLPVLGVRRQY